ncbi:MAG: hypothetical protein E6I62_01530 [Chloroflexi bacterium]|nr:MAG: hypothetical protein E6I62_01530 [Chloroflexota bacterium]
MTSQPPPRAPGYRGTLPPRTDRLAVPWVITVVAVFLLVFVLAFAGVPSKFFPTSSVTPGASGVPSGSPAASPS